MLVVKFGGSCLLDTAAFRSAAALLAHRCLAEDPVIAVVSATAGTTDSLTKGRVEAEICRHLALFEELGGCACDWPDLAWEALESAEILALGERMAVLIMAAAAAEIGLAPLLVDPGDLGLITGEDPERAHPVEGWRERMAAALVGRRGLLLVPGFFGRDQKGRRRLLGRNSSDFSAALIAAAGTARRVEIIASAPGLMTADPELVPTARLLPVVGHDEIAEIAAAGARVLHAESLRIARDVGLEIHLTDLQGETGTRIVGESESQRPFKALVHHSRVTLAILEPCDDAELARVFAEALELLERAKIRPLVTASSGSSLSLALPGDATDLFESITGITGIARVRYLEEQAALELVGRGLTDLVDGPARVLATLARAKISATMIAEPAGRPAIHLILPRASLPEAAALLHDEFC